MVPALSPAPAAAEGSAPAPAVGFAPGSETRRLDREAILLLGAGPRALLMQLAHPLVAEGVDQHSGFREDPWIRLAGTLRSYLGIVYGGEAAARAEVARLARLHERVAGPVRDPLAREVTGADRYEARDPELALWVHATLVDATLATYRAWGEPLGPVDRERAYAETLPLGRAFGIPEALLPPDLPAFEAYLARMLGPGGPVRVTPTARSLAATVLHPPLGPLVRRGRFASLEPLLARIPPRLYDWTLWPALELLPGPVRTGYGIPRTALRRVVAAWLLAGWRLWRPLVPRSFRWMPQARRADARAIGGAR